METDNPYAQQQQPAESQQPTQPDAFQEVEADAVAEKKYTTMTSKEISSFVASVKEVVTNDLVDNGLMGLDEFWPLMDSTASLLFVGTVSVFPWKEREVAQHLGVLMSKLRQNPYEFDQQVSQAIAYLQTQKQAGFSSIKQELISTLQAQQQHPLFVQADADLQAVALFKFFYVRLMNLTDAYTTEVVFNRGLVRTMFQSTLLAWFEEQNEKTAIVLQELGRWLFGYHLMFSNSLGYDQEQYLISEHLTEMSRLPADQWPPVGLKPNQEFGNAGFPSLQAMGQLDQQGQAKVAQVQEKYNQIMKNAYSELESIRKQAFPDSPLPVLKLDKVFAPANGQASHVVISISGFMSEKDNKKEKWQTLKKHLTFGEDGALDSTAAVFSLTWEAGTMTDVTKVGVKSAMSAASSLFKAYKTKGLSSKLSLVGKGLSELKGVANKFGDHQQQAKLAGKLLGISLALRYPFGFQNVSLLGFSLGTQVTKSCLNTLSRIYFGGVSDKGQPNRPLGIPCDIIHNVTLLGGAVCLSKKPEKWRFIFEQLVNDRTKNVFSKGDTVLSSSNSMKVLKDAAGSRFVEIPCSVKGSEVLENFDISTDVALTVKGRVGHMQYMEPEVLKAILEHIDMR